MSYYHILTDLHQEINPQQSLDLESDSFETEIQSLSERLAEVLANHHALIGKTSNASDFKLMPDLDTYRQVYRKSLKIYQGFPVFEEF